jgi:hypothetical protein
MLKTSGGVSNHTRMATMDNHTSDIPLKRCTGCGNEYPATTEFFYKHPAGLHGLRARCKACCRNYFKEFPPATSGVKTCSACGQTFPATAEYFHRNKRHKTGLTCYCKSCAINRTKDWEREHPEQRDLSKRLWRERNQERLNAKSRQTRRENGVYKREYWNNREQHLSKAKQYYHEHRDEINAYKKEWRKGYVQRSKELVAQWHKNNPERSKQIAQLAVERRLARKRGLPATLSNEQWEQALEYFGYQCACCGQLASELVVLAADHWLPISKPDCPGTVALNIIPLCHARKGHNNKVPCCNNSKGSKDAETWLVERFGEYEANEILSRIEAYFEWVRQQDA